MSYSDTALANCRSNSPLTWALARRIWVIFVVIGVTGCSTYTPLRDPALYHGKLKAPAEQGVRVAFLGNTTLYISDGKTRLLIDGFLSRPGPLKTLFCRLEPDSQVIKAVLARSGIEAVDAILVGHAHHDHALDAPFIAQLMNAKVVGSSSYSRVHEGAGGSMDASRLTIVKSTRESEQFGDFTVTFCLSAHVGSHSLVQCAVEGSITEKFSFPAHFSRFKHGDVYAIHIAHREHGRFVVTTTAGARKDQLSGLSADVVFLGVGLFAKEPKITQDRYWHEAVENVNPHTVIPIHWDSFTRKLDCGLKPPFYDNIKRAMEIVKSKGGDRNIFVMDLGDSVLLQRGHLR